MLDFPNSPAVGQLFPSPRVVDVPVWQWNGVTWRPTAANTQFLLVAGHQTTTGGFRFTSYGLGAISSGTVTPDAMNGNYQYLTNTGAFTLAAPSTDCAIDLMVINSVGAGVVTFSGFTVGSNTGEPLNTVNGNKFVISIRRINGVATYLIKGLQ
jgi:hypothetical protein